jgi:acyl-coenzyme A synthetase/AMP-(fatty) acid ligase
VNGSGDLTRDAVLDHCRQWLPAYMVPDVIEFREALPRTSTGKVDRAGLALELNEPRPSFDRGDQKVLPVTQAAADLNRG